MKNIYFMLIISLFMFMPFIVNAETCNKDDISITSINLEKKNGRIEEKSEAKIEDKNINLDLNMTSVGDSIIYKLEVKNDSDEDYELDKNSINVESDYVSYSFETEDNSKIIEAKSRKTVYLKVSYDVKVPDEAFKGDTYNEDKQMVVNLSSNNEEPVNVPDTWTISYIVVGIFLIISLGVMYKYMGSNRLNLFTILFISSIYVLIPITVNAICKCEISVDSKVEIHKEEIVMETACLYIGESGCYPTLYNEIEKKMVTYPKGMKLKELEEREMPILLETYPDIDRYLNHFFVKKEVEACELEAKRLYPSTSQYKDYSNAVVECSRNNIERITYTNETEYMERYNEYMETEVRPASEGCYIFSMGTLC